jgi:hypothetical protein
MKLARAQVIELEERDRRGRRFKHALAPAVVLNVRDNIRQIGHREFLRARHRVER